MSKKHKKHTGDENVSNDPDGEFKPTTLQEPVDFDAKNAEEQAEAEQPFVDPQDHLLTKDKQDGAVDHAPPDETKLGKDFGHEDTDAAPFSPDDPRVIRTHTPSIENVDVPRSVPMETEAEKLAGKVTGNRSARDALEKAAAEPPKPFGDGSDLLQNPDAFKQK